MVDVAVIGAGLTGLVVAEGLAGAGHAVGVFEKSRGLGGRLSTRRADGGLRFDHGAQYLRPTRDDFAAFLARLGAAGAAALWHLDRADAWVGQPGMSGLIAPLTEGLDIRQPVQIATVTREGGVWRLADAQGGDQGTAKTLVLAIPAPQAAQLLAGHGLADALTGVMFSPCWTLMAAFASPLGLPESHRDPDGAIAWMVRDSGKPGRPARPEGWIAQMSAGWSAEHLERPAEDIRDEILAMISERLQRPLPEPVYAAAHRWRYSTAAHPLGQPCLADHEARLVVAGDWCLGDRAEHAFHSAQAALAVLRDWQVG